MFFYLLVSDHVVTLLCLSVEVDFFDFPIDFFWGLPPSLYADEVLCAAFRAARTPPIFYSGEATITKWRNSMQVHKTFFFMERVCKSWALVQARVTFSCFFIFLAKNMQHKLSTNIAKIELSFEPELNFCNFLWLKNEPPKALWTPTWLQHFPKTR